MTSESSLNVAGERASAQSPPNGPEPKRPSWFRRRWKQLFLLAMTTLISFVVGEVCFRVYVMAHFRTEAARHNRLALEDKKNLYVIEPDKDYLYRMRPGAQGEFQISVSETQKIWWSCKTNADGFRGRLLGDKKPGVARLIFLGDSYTFGWGLNEEQIPYPQGVAMALNDDRATTRAEALNAGTPGYNTEMEYHLLREIAPRYDPDIVVLSFVMNDAEPQATVLASHAQTYRYARSWMWEGLKKMSPDHPALEPLLFFVSALTFNALEGQENVSESNYLIGFEPKSPKWKTAKKALAGIVDLCRDRNYKLLVCILPDFSRYFTEEYPFDSIHERVARWCEHYQTPVIDLMPAFRGKNHEDYWIKGDGHPNALAHRIMARQIADKIESLGWIP